MNNAIKLAIEKGGFLIHDGVAFDAMQGATYAKQFVVLNPLFWQALGKARALCQSHPRAIDRCDFCISNKGWQEIALSYFDLILTGGDTEKFWKALL